MPSSVDLGSRLEKIVEDLVERGRYNSRSEVIRAGIRLLHERESRLAEFEVAIDRALADSQAGRVEDVEIAIARLKSKMIAKYRRSR